METDARQRTTPAAAAGATCDANVEPFDEWASRQRQRASRDGAWKIEVAERTVCGNIVRTVTSWHDTAKRQPAPLRRAQQQGSVCADRSKQQSTRFATDKLYPQRLTARQQRSALRSAAHHRLMRLRVLRRLWLAVRFTVRLSRLSAATRALRGGPSPGKRRLSPSPDEQHDPLLHTTLSCSDGASERPEVARSGWVRRVLSRVGFGDG